MPDTEPYSAQKYFDRLTDAYLNHQNDEDAKCKEFRTVMDDFFHQYVIPESTETDTWNDLQKLWYQNSGNRQLNKIITDLRVDLNKITHGKMHVTGKDRLYYYYRVCILVLINISEEQPDNRTRVACGEVDTKYLESLNDQQRDIIVDSSRITYVNAGPGTGKTHLLVYKIIDILSKEKKDANIVALSYTRSSAASLSAKLNSTIQKMNLLQESIPYSGTIHSFCLNSLRDYKAQSGERFDYIIADDSEIEEIVDDIYYSFDGAYEREVILQCYKASSGIEDEQLLKAINDRKEIYKRISVGEILGVYLRTLRDDEEFLKWCEKRMNWLLVDEAQDLTAENYAIFDTLLETMPGLKVFLVGDPRQNIFEFLGGSFKYLNEFLEKYDGQISKKYLSYSYRCPQKVLDFTNEMDFRDCENITLNSKSSTDGSIEVSNYDDDYEEAHSIVKYIKDRGDFGNIAILSSKLRDLSKIVDELNAHDISFVIKGGSKTVKSHIQAFACMNKIVATKGKALGPCNGLCDKIEIPKCKTVHQFFATDIGKAIQQYAQSYSSANITYLELSRKFVELCRKFLPDGNRKAQDEDFAKLYNMVIKKTDSPEGFSNVFKSFKSQFESLEVEFRSTGHSAESVTLSTVHSAKGLEWDCVILPGMCDKYFPNPKSLEAVDPEARKDALNTSKKLMFVAVTRTKNRLWVTYPSMLRDSRSQTGPSRLLGSLALM